MDASAIYAVIKDEPGSSIIRDILEQSTITTFNIAEVVNKVVLKKQASHMDIWILLSSIIHNPYPIDMNLTELATSFSEIIDSHLGISLGDKYCLALGKLLNKPIYTCDHIWKRLEKPLGITVQLIR